VEVSSMIAGVAVAACLGGGLIVLGFVALVRANKEDIPEVVKALAPWWRGGKS
jgi:hypothetical protein